MLNAHYKAPMMHPYMAIALTFSVCHQMVRAYNNLAMPCQVSRSLTPSRHGQRSSPVALLALRDGMDDKGKGEAYRTKFVEDSKEARDLRNLRYEDDDDDEAVNDLVIEKDYYYYEDDDDEFFDDPSYREPISDEDTVGNFWSNPKPGFDTPLPPEVTLDRRRPSEFPAKVAKDLPPRRPRPRRVAKKQTTFRSGDPKPPQKVEDFYDKFFWYGFNPDDNIAPGDKTVFGGTKGKFNGLDIYYDDERKPTTTRRRRRPPQTFRADEWYEDIMDSIENEGRAEEMYDEDDGMSTRRPSLSEEEYYEESYDERSPRRPRDVYLERDDVYVKRERSPRKSSSRRKERDWISDKVSGWFGPDDSQDEYEQRDDYERERRPSRRSKDDSSFSLTNVLDGIFRVNREQVDMNAAMYSRQMGLEKPARSKRRPDRQRRKGYAYPYVADADESIPTSDYDKPALGVDVMDVVDVDAVIEDVEEAKEPDRKREQTIEQRAAAFERVPPSGIPAWGPSGEVGVDARTKATLDALEDIREATRKVELKEEQSIEAKEDLVVLKADFELQKKRLLASIDDKSRIRSRLRQMQMGVQDAALALRRAKAELDVARDRLVDLEDRHWALLSMYDADKAFQEVVETFREFEESERLSTKQWDSKDESAEAASGEPETDTDVQTKDDTEEDKGGL